MKNIYLAYILAFLNKAWFWGAIWILYYLRFTDYSGIGLIESIMIVLSIFLEIPTGAIGDLLGKRKTLIIAMLCCVIGNIIMALSPNISVLLFSVIFMTIGSALYSGTFEAFIYDTLKEHKQEDMYDRVISNVSSIDSVSMGITAIIGGFLYTMNPTFPFYATAATYFLGALLAFFLVEPKIDSEQFSFSNFISQNKMGLHELFHSKKNTIIILFLLPLMSVYVFGYQFLQDAIHLDLGFTGQQLGFIVAGICIVAAIFSQFTHIVRKKVSFVTFTLFSSLFTGIIFIAISFVSPILAILLSYLRIGTLTIQYNLSSQVINTLSSSKNRATTLSTFSLLTNIPYVITAFFMGEIIDNYSALTFAYYLGMVLFVISLYQLVLYKTTSNIFNTK